MGKISSFLLFISIICSCNHKTEEKIFPEKYNLKGENIGPKNFFLRPVRCIIDSSFILVLDSKTDCFFHIYTLDFKLLKSLVNQGRGPEEIISPHISQQDFIHNRRIVYYDPYQNIIGELYFSDIDSFKISQHIKRKVPDNIINIQNILFTGNDKFVARGCGNAGKMCFFNLKDFTYKFTDFLPDVKYEKSKADFFDMFNGELAFNSLRNSVVCSNRYFNQLELYTVDGELIKEIRAGKLQNPFQENYLYCYNAVYSTTDYIFASYLGVNMKDLTPARMKNKCSIIQVFDWEGNPIMELNLDRLTGYFAVDNNLEFIICIDETNHDQPLVRYEIKGLLKQHNN